MPKGELVVFGKFEWFAEKEAANIAKHKDRDGAGISFKAILSVFDDPFFMSFMTGNTRTQGRTGISGSDVCAARD